MSAQRIATVLILLATATMTPAPVDAQWRPLYPGYYRYAEPESDLKFDVTPKDAAVYVDGYFAGKVDDYNGAFERLHVSPGEHEIVVYLEGYRSLRQRLYLSPNRTRKIEGELERLTAGEAAEPMPVPRDRPQTLGPAREGDENAPGRSAPRRRLPPPPRDRQPQPAPNIERSPSNSASGTLSIRVQPGGATVLIDGEQWEGPSNGDERLIVQVAEGHHTVEVRHDGFQRFVTEIDVRRGQTEPVNISLVRSR